MWDIRSKKVLMTGATSGFGKIAAIEMARRGASVIIACRNLEKGKSVVSEYGHSLTRKGSISLLECDLSSLNSIKKACAEVKTKYKTLDILINNAGLWNYRRKLSHDGIEETFAVNFLAPYFMTMELTDILNPKEARIIFTASALHQGKVNFDDPEFRQNYSGVKAYRQSKLSIILLTRLLARKFANTHVTVNCQHPGLVSTNLGREAGIFSHLLFKAFGKSPEKGAETLLYLATSDDVSHITGEYFADSTIAKTAPETYDLTAAEQLLETARKYLSVRFPEQV